MIMLPVKRRNRVWPEARTPLSATLLCYLRFEQTGTPYTEKDNHSPHSLAAGQETAACNYWRGFSAASSTGGREKAAVMPGAARELRLLG